MLVRATINDRERDIDLLADSSLLALLRDSLGLTGVLFGCGHGACGAC
ncbi:2Fe-2S iron-sulfur cluster-binding protein [Mesorhizobium sp. J8]